MNRHFPDKLCPANLMRPAPQPPRHTPFKFFANGWKARKWGGLLSVALFSITGISEVRAQEPSANDDGMLRLQFPNNPISDILGIYELLTGTTPFEQERLSEANYDELRRIICEEEPPRPSDRLSKLNNHLAETIGSSSNN